MSDDPRHALGRLGEDLALAHLERLGYALVARNHRTRFGELDLVVADADDARVLRGQDAPREPARREPWEALHEPSSGRCGAMAAAFLAEVADRPRRPAVRFDAIGVVVDARGALVRLDHLEAAF